MSLLIWLLGCNGEDGPTDIPLRERPAEEAVSRRQRVDPLYRTQRTPSLPEGVDISGTSYVPNIFTGFLIEVPFEGDAQLTGTFDVDARQGIAQPTFPGLPVADGLEWMTWSVDEGRKVLAPRRGTVVEAGRVSACNTGKKASGVVIASGWFGLEVELRGLEPSVRSGDEVVEGQTIGVVWKSDTDCDPGLSLTVLNGATSRNNPIMRRDVGPFFRLDVEDWQRLLGQEDAAEQIQQHALVCRLGIAAAEDCPLPMGVAASRTRPDQHPLGNVGTGEPPSNQ